MVYMTFHIANYYSHIVVVFMLLFVVPFQGLDKRRKKSPLYGSLI